MLGVTAFFLLKDSIGHNDENRILLASVSGGLWHIFYLGDCANPNFSSVVACPSDAPMQLCC